MRRLPPAVLTALTALVVAAPAGAAAAQRHERPLRNIDVRKADGGPSTPAERRARAQLERELGDEGVVMTDRVSGGARLVARTDGFLTRRRAAPATSVALEYVRERPEVFGIDADGLAGLRLTSSYRSDGGVTHLAYTQTYRGVAAYDNVLLANVDEDGRLLNAGGSPVSGLRVASVAPDLDAQSALAVARREVGGALVPRRARQGRGPERPTRFAGGDTARLVLLSDGAATRLAWELVVTGEHDYVYEFVVDATSGAVLKRRSLTEFADAHVYRNFPGAAAGGTLQTVDLATDPTWLNASAANTKLSGNNAHAYVDVNAANGFTAGQDLEVPASAGGDWIYDPVAFALPGCPPTACTWNSASPATRTTNRNQATTQLFYLVNAFHDHLEAPPIGFTPATRNFEAAGNDAVQAETDNFNNPDGTAPPPSVNNASMTTLPDGSAPLMQMFLFTSPSLNATDTADVVYHEYTHGLTNRSVGSGVGLDANQSRAMGEAWSDWYALDFLDLQSLRVDHGGTRGEMTLGGYLQPGGLRTQGADCDVGTNDPACPGTGPGNPGGYTFGDMGTIKASGFEVHADGEIWLETLWDLRQALTPPIAESLITSGLRLAPNNPSLLEARDAILLADQNAGGANYQAIWTVFADRGMGLHATTTISAATTAVDNFDLPPRLERVATAVSDPAPGGDGDDVPEPGETISVSERLRNPNPTPTTGITGVLATAAPGFTIGQPNTTWQDINVGQAETSAPPFRVTLPSLASPNASCDTTAALNLSVDTNESAPFTIPLAVPIGSKSTEDPPATITPTTVITPASGITSTVTFNTTAPPGPGTVVNDLEVRISKLSHTWVGDLVITLTHGPKTVTLMSRPGAGPDGASGNDFTDLVLDDDDSTPIEAIPATNPPGGYSGRFKPDSPLAAFDGDDRQGAWTLTVNDLFGAEDSGTLKDWGIRPSGAGCPNRAPEAAADVFSVAGGQTLSAPSVLTNDADPDGDPLTAVKTSDPVHGTVALAADGTFSYTPEASFRGTDSFTYRVSDAGLVPLASAPATVTISVGNTPPAAADDAYTATSGVALDGSSVLANDSDPNGDPLTAVLASGPAHGTLSLAPGGTFTYVPDASFSGRDAFTYTATDATDASAVVTAAIDVSTAAAPAPAPAPPAPSPPPPAPRPATVRAPAKLEVLRAGVSGGRLDVLAAITTKATGTVRVRYRSAGATTTFDAAISGGRIRFAKALPRSQRSKPTGIFTLTFAGTALVAPDDVTLRAARGKARLVRSSSAIDASGRLRAAGTISPRARGVVRVRLGYADAGGETTFLDYSAKIAGGRWSLVQQLPAAAAKAGGQLSIQFTGYDPRRIRGEQIAKDVAPGG